jgi:mRNA-degrading endonuclease YafQ of YafQ-DinJ toxin-antitoxin module
LRTVGDDGVTNLVQSGTSDRTYAQIESRLYDLAPTTADSSSGGRTARQARERSDRLSGDETSFSTVLRPYLRDQDPYVTRIRDDPLVGTVRSVRNQVGTDDVLVIVTSDTDPTTLTEAAKTAIRGGGRTILFLTPQCLFEPTGLTDLDAAYDQYRTFETLRRDLDTHPRMTALEIAPDSRVDAVLAHRRMTSTSR